MPESQLLHKHQHGMSVAVEADQGEAGARLRLVIVCTICGEEQRVDAGASVVKPFQRAVAALVAEHGRDLVLQALKEAYQTDLSI